MFMLLLAVSLAGFELRESTQRADWYVLSDRPELKVDVRECERFLLQTERTFGVVVPRFTYRRVETAAEVSVFAGVYADGAANASQSFIVAIEACLKHEIVHLVTGQISEPDRIFEEGTAAMLGRDYGWRERRRIRTKARILGQRYGTVERSFRRTVESTGELRHEYILADAWVRHIARHHGIPKLVDFFRAYGTQQDVREAFRSVYGADLDDAFDHWLYGKKGPPGSKPRQK